MNAVAGVDGGLIDALGIRRLVSDSRAVRAGDTFVAYPGETRDGRDFIAQAVQSGAASVLWEPAGFHWKPSWRTKHLAVGQLRQKIGLIASHVYGRPSSRLWMVGVTGTNGKTSCSQWIVQALNRLNRRCALAGTLGNGFPGALESGVNTTPDAAWLHGKLRDWNREGAAAVAMEVSSHGLEQGRVAGVEFDVALLTNLTRDHLDYHGTMLKYRRAKARLFEWETLKWRVLNLDDRFGVELARLSRPGCVLGYGFTRPAAVSRHVPSVQGRNLRLSLEGVSFDVATPWGAARLRSNVLGRFNASNLLGTLAVLLASNIGLRDAVRVLADLDAVPGRAERFGGGRSDAGPLVVVDYAHTPDALEKILLTLRELKTSARREITCVFGCGGDRDRGKRAMMGRIATRCADRVIVTSDNPRGENPMAIIADILEGASRDCEVIEDRAGAVREAIRSASRGDIVVVAGKGHESYQEIRGVRYPYSDTRVVRAALMVREARALQGVGA